MVANVERLHAAHFHSISTRRYVSRLITSSVGQLTRYAPSVEPNNRSPLNVEAADLWDNTEAVSLVLDHAQGV